MKFKILIPKEATRMGFEPTTSAVTGRRSNQLSHRAIQVFNIPSKPHIEIIFTVSSTNQTFLDKPSTD